MQSGAASVANEQKHVRGALTRDQSSAKQSKCAVVAPAVGLSHQHDSVAVKPVQV